MKQELRASLRLAVGGRIVIPAAMRQRLGLHVGSNVVRTVENDHAVLMNAKAARRRAQRRVRRYVTPVSASAKSCWLNGRRRPSANRSHRGEPG